MQRLQSTTYICARCLRKRSASKGLPAARFYSSDPNSSPPSSEKTAAPCESNRPRPKNATPKPEAGEKGAMSRRLDEATEEALLTGGLSGLRSIEEAGFSEELKERLYDKIASAEFRARYSRAFSQAGTPQSGSPTSFTAVEGEPWTGEERQNDAVRRMLEDARKPLSPELRGKFRPPDPTRGSQPVYMRILRDAPVSRGQRVASARDRATAYVGMGLGKIEGKEAERNDTKGLSEAEKEAVKREFKERFAPGARSVSSISGIAALANQRIEDAIARGQFKNIPRGPDVERDARADNPFIDTTEYIMNKMIKRQDIVPPWIEKQQQLAKDAKMFRTRLRADWLRHAARSIASKGGTVEEQVARAEAYARAEAVLNPARRRNPEEVSLASTATDDPVMVKVRQSVEATTAPHSSTPHAPPGEEQAVASARVFRDPTWEATEQKYLSLEIDNLNALTRSYNLMAPELAKKAYFSLQRELSACFADVAPRVGQEIRNRATARPVGSLADGMFGGMGGAIGGGKEGRGSVYENKAPYYGLKEMWRDWWGKTA